MNIVGAMSRYLMKRVGIKREEYASNKLLGLEACTILIPIIVISNKYSNSTSINNL